MSVDFRIVDLNKAYVVNQNSVLRYTDETEEVTITKLLVLRMGK